MRFQRGLPRIVEDPRDAPRHAPIPLIPLVPFIPLRSQRLAPHFGEGGEGDEGDEGDDPRSEMGLNNFYGPGLKPREAAARRNARGSRGTSPIPREALGSYENP